MAICISSTVGGTYLAVCKLLFEEPKSSSTLYPVYATAKSTKLLDLRRLAILQAKENNFENSSNLRQIQQRQTNRAVH